MCVVNNRFVDEEKKKIGLLYIMVGRRIFLFFTIFVLSSAPRSVLFLFLCSS